MSFSYPVGDEVAGWAPRPRAEAIRLEGRYAVLVPLGLEHAPALHAALASPRDRELWTYRPTWPPADEAAMVDLLQQHLDARPDLETFVITPHGGRPEGITCFTRIEPAHGQVEIASVLYSRALQRTPAATETTYLLLRHAFDTLGYRRVEWKCDSLNEPSRRAAARLGFTYEGRFRHHMVTKGRSRDTDWFSITDAEWPTIRETHERWLDPANFDEAGLQLSPLRPAGD